ncbi:MAG: hypothetical protein WA324_29025 [Bryobacteraceae bacterium]
METGTGGSGHGYFEPVIGRVRFAILGALLLAIAGATGCRSAKEPPPYAPHVVVRPSSGEGTAQEFAVTIAPADKLKMAGLLINSESSGSKSCYTLVNVADQKFYLVKDPGWGSLPFTLGSSAENSQCSAHVTKTHLDLAKNSFEFHVTAEFKPIFGGGQLLYVFTSDRNGSGGLQQAGSWMVAP